MAREYNLLPDAQKPYPEAVERSIYSKAPKRTTLNWPTLDQKQ
jgi:hypothetical protein